MHKIQIIIEILFDDRRSMDKSEKVMRGGKEYKHLNINILKIRKKNLTESLNIKKLRTK